VQVGIVDAWNDSTTRGIDNARGGADQLAHIVVAQCGHAAVFDGHGIAPVMRSRRVHGVDRSIHDHQISEIFHQFSSVHRI
jgi:hypothetical protein